MKTLLSAAVGIAVLALAGCGGATADVSGKVTLTAGRWCTARSS